MCGLVSHSLQNNLFPPPQPQLTCRIELCEKTLKFQKLIRT